ncbi:NAD-dependent dehydrogenase subunit [Isosphaera pallida ATCC 43644]|uniref:NAD-dependent dehydrogenase subunit n=1 Tax=Isosphaera pallida (strain ATCC 43644 / DSM 9630 / IS1B) TaxID=575540 RepID=E8QXY3_ISOPI|nr:NADH-quinone oxidoreductase subunit K [Isosphaera pallida]ADV60962.1 NAD-dependent dehydrogenase subunit [Isosphaera pallida ATCC 43644]
MTGLLEPALIVVILTNLAITASSRLAFGIRLVATQGVVAGLMPLVLSPEEVTVRLVVIGGLTVVLKGIVFPRLLDRTLRQAAVRREEDPPFGYKASIVGGVVTLGLAFWLTGPNRMPLPAPLASPLQLPAAVFTLLTGLFLIVARNNALNQVLGYLVMENGIFLIGLALALEEPLLLEMGILLDVFFGVLVMGVAIFHISRAFDSIEVDELTTLKD